MNYPCGKKIEFDDLVIFGDIELPGKITHFVETDDDVTSWGSVGETGVFIECEIFGWLFLPETKFSDHKLQPFFK